MALCKDDTKCGERSPECAGKLQQLSIAYHKEMESGRLQSKIMRDVEQVETLSSQIFITMLSILLNVVVALGIVLTKDRIVFAFLEQRFRLRY